MTTSESLLADAGVIEMRGGDPRHSRDEHFEIRRDGLGYRVATRIVAASGDYDLRTEFLYTHDWLPRVIHGSAARGNVTQERVRITKDGSAAQIEITDASAGQRMQTITCRPDTLVDLEPSTLPMWAMTRRYDRTLGGTQIFSWVGRSLLRDLTLESLETPLTRVGVDASGEDFEFSETYPLPGDGCVTLPFTLRVDAQGRLQRFSVGAGAQQVTGMRRLPLDPG